MLSTPSTLQKYAVAAGVLLLAFGLRYGIYGTLDHRLPFAFFLPATIVAAWYGGLGPGLLAALGGLLLGDYFFLAKLAEGGTASEAARTATGLYAMNCALIVVLFGHLHTRLRSLRDELRKVKGGPGSPG